MTTLTGKVALVTGGSRGIGAAIAGALAHQGANVAITYKESKDLAEEVVTGIITKGGMAVALRADVAEPEDIAAAVTSTVSRFGTIDILVNSAGLGSFGSFGSVTLEELDRVIAVNVKGVFVTTQAVEPHLPNGGRIINVGSCLSERVPGPGMALYAMSKSALTGLTKGLARELGSRAITVNLVQPGPTNTDMNPENSEMADFQRGITALGRYAQPEDIAAVVAHLAAPSSGYVTGASVAVDGGATA